MSEHIASIAAKQGYDGQEFCQSVVSDGEYGIYIGVHPYHDLDNGAMDDVIVISESYDSATDESTARVYAMQGYNEYQLWTRNVTGKDV